MQVSIGTAFAGSSPVMTGCEMCYWVADGAARGLADSNSSINLTSRVCHAAAAIAGAPVGITAGSAAIVIGSAGMATEYLTNGWVTMYPLANRLKVIAVDRLGRHLFGVICPVEANQCLQNEPNTCRDLIAVNVPKSNSLLGSACQYVTAAVVNQLSRILSVISS